MFFQYRNCTTVETELNDENLQLRENNNEEDINLYALPIYAVINKKKDAIAVERELNDENLDLRDNQASLFITIITLRVTKQ